MPIYAYKAKTTEGKIRKGELPAAHMEEFYQILKDQNLFCLEVSPVEMLTERIRTTYKLTTLELILFCRKLESMLKAGMGISYSLNVLANTSDNRNIKKLYVALYECIQRGSSLSEAMLLQGHSLPHLVIDLTRSGEASGNLDMIMHKLGNHYEKQGALNAKIRAATTYPVILLCITFVVVLVLFIKVLPNMFAAFDTGSVPPITQVMMNISSFLQENVILVFSGIIAFVGLLFLIHSIPFTRRMVDRIKIYAPFIGRQNKKVYSSHFASTMAILYSSGIPLMTCLKQCATIIKNRVVQDHFVTIIERVSMGNSISSSMEEAGVFDPLLPCMVKIGEQSSCLDTVLLTTSDFFDAEASRAVDKMLGLLEPVLLVSMALVIGSVVLSVMLPIFNVYQNIQ